MRKVESSSPLSFSGTVPISPAWDDRFQEPAPRGEWCQWETNPVAIVETVETVDPSDAMLLELGTSEVEKTTSSEEGKTSDAPLQSFRAMRESIESLRREVDLYSKVVVSCRTRIDDLRGKMEVEKEQCSTLRCFINASELRDVGERGGDVTRRRPSGSCARSWRRRRDWWRLGVFVANRGKGGEAGTQQREVAVAAARLVGKEEPQDLDELRMQLENQRADRFQVARIGGFAG